MSQFATVIGMDLGDKTAHLCVLDAEGEVLEEAVLRLSKAAINTRFGALPATRVVMEVGSNARWVGAHIAELGHEVLVADARQLKLISASNTKSDRNDAEILARLGRADDLKLLKPVVHRSEATHTALAVVRSRKVAVQARVQLINSVRGQLKSMGHRLPGTATYRFHRLLDQVPPRARPAIEPLMAAIAQLSLTIATFDGEIERIGQEDFPETELLRQVPGVGPIVALTFLLTIEDPSRFESTRAVGAYLGLVPRRSQSGGVDPRLSITKAGDVYLRKLLNQSAHYVLGHFGPDCELRRWGLKMAGEDGINKRKAVTAVARKLSVLLLTLWKTGSVYEPFHHGGRPEAQERILEGERATTSPFLPREDGTRAGSLAPSVGQAVG